jgi:hypothetical protein
MDTKDFQSGEASRDHTWEFGGGHQAILGIAIDEHIQDFPRSRGLRDIPTRQENFA